MHVLTIPLLALVVMTSAWYLTRSVLSFALRRNLLDVPNHRSSQGNPTPCSGGCSFVLTFSLAASIFGVLHLLQPVETLGLLLGLLVVGVGCWDDYIGLPIRVRLLVQLAACASAVACLGGLARSHDLTGNATVAFAAVLGTWLALAWLINFANFMDGINGIAGAEAVIVAGICCALSTMAHGVNVVALLFAVLAASATGFLIWNWYPARIFMGDAGAGFLASASAL